MLRCLQWFKINEENEYKLMSLSFKLLTTTWPHYLYNLISIQPTHCTHSSPIVALSLPRLKSPLGRFVLLQPIFGADFSIHFGTPSFTVSSLTPFSTCLFITPTLTILTINHSFTTNLQLTCFRNPFHHTVVYHWTTSADLLTCFGFSLSSVLF